METISQLEAQTSQQERPKRIRRKPYAIQLEVALRSGARAVETNADPSTKNLIQTMIQTLSLRLSREENGKLKRALERIVSLEAEITRLRELLAQPISSEAERLRRLVAAHAPAGGNNASV